MFYLGASDGQVLVKRRPGECLQNCLRLRHTGPSPRDIVWGAICYDSRSPLVIILNTPIANLCISLVIQPIVLPFMNIRNVLYRALTCYLGLQEHEIFLQLSSYGILVDEIIPTSSTATTDRSNIETTRMDLHTTKRFRCCAQVQLKDKYLRLETAQEAVSGALLQLRDNGKEFENELFDLIRIDNKLGETVISEVPDTPRKFKLPKLELRKFGGDPKEFLSFWSQFQKIHDDGSIPDEDKMQYLVASVEPKSKAERLILSFPATAANYPKAVDQLKERFGREDPLVQIYVRDLLTMVMKNAVSGRAKRTFQDSMTSWRES
ncbi:DUF1758 domain-containing protein [Trichonephila clavipes]|nr:DUF1758 domain-containing protein [Trichonephila clavipes]